MFAENSKEQLFQRYNKSVVVVFSSIMLLAFIITLYNYFLARQVHRDAKLVEMSEYSAQINNKLTSTVETLTGMRDLAEYYLRFPAELPSKMPALQQEGPYFFLNKTRENVNSNNRIISGNISGVGRIERFSQSFKEELIMANALTPAFVTAQESIKSANWLYYISVRRFVNLYPWVPRSIWQYSDQSLTNSLMLKIKASKDKDENFWSRPYVDSAGKGLNAALGIGVYLNSKIKGAVLIDINTAGLKDYLPSINQDGHGYMLVDKQSHVLLHKRSAELMLRTDSTFSEEAPEQLSQLSYQSIVDITPNSELGDWVVQQTLLPINDWVLLEYQKKSNFYSAINQRFFAIFISISFGLLTLLIVVYYVTHRSFIAPSKKFINHIENCSAGDPGKIKPSKEWLHWFKIVEDLFGENRSLMQRLKDQNNELDLRVKEKTQALFYKSEQHQRDYALLRSVMDAIPDLILFNDPQGCLIGCNQALENLVQKKEAYILGAPITDIVASALGQNLADNLRRDQSAQSIIASHKTVSTQQNTYEIYQAPFYTEHSSLLGSIILIRDVTQQFESNQALQRAKNQAEEANKIKSQFLANMSHEIRTPINAIQGMFYLLQQSQLDKVQEQYLTNAESASNTLLYLVNELLDSAKVESGNMSIHKELVNLESIVSQALNLNVGSVVGHDLDLQVAIESNVPMQINTDTMRLVQVLSNLLNNAIKFTQQGSVTLSVALLSDTSPLAEDRAICFTVTDTGIGIEKSKQLGLFEAFKQADESMTRVYGGTGLGLSICQHIAQLLGGKITIESELGQGAEFTLTLPLEIPTNSQAGVRLADNVEHFRKIFSTTSLVNLAVELPITLRDNFTGINQSIIDILTLNELTKLPPQGPIILFVNSSHYTQGLSQEALTIISKNVAILALCQPIGCAISTALSEQLNQHKVNYLLLEFPLYRQVITKLANGLTDSKIDAQTFQTKVKTTKKTDDGENLLGLNILLVEDNLVNQLVATKLLESLQATVVIAQNGQEALEKLPSQAFDIVLMDIQMPIMDGLTASERIRALPQYNALPIIAMTAHAREEDIQQCMAAGMNLHIAKPISFHVLRDSILSQLKK